jgi:hypothetical protein
MIRGMTEPTRRGPGVVAALASVLALLIVIWVVGALLLVRYADRLPGAPTPSTSPTTPDRIG